jgi:hypothetical protein
MADNVHVLEHQGDEARLDKIIVERLALTARSL